MHPYQQLAQYFLERIHHYYPIGLPHFAPTYPGFQELQEIQRKKFIALEQEEPKAWYSLVEAVQNEWSGCQIFNSVAAQFPCYEVQISLTEAALTGLHIHSSLTLSVSLLVKHYAIVVIDDYSYTGPEHSGAWHKFICSGVHHHLKLDAKIEALKRIVQGHFPEHQHAPHEVLFKYKVQGGYPYKGSYDDLGEYTIYDYLFSGGLFGQQYTVAH